jgi:hypothetical protein
MNHLFLTMESGTMPIDGFWQPQLEPPLIFCKETSTLLDIPLWAGPGRGVPNGCEIHACLYGGDWRNGKYTLEDCNQGCPTAEARQADLCENILQDAFHKWDTAVVFYTGSVVDGTGIFGDVLYSLAEKRCRNFTICTDSESLVPNVNTDEGIGEFRQGQSKLAIGNCLAARESKERVGQLKNVPLIQSTLRFFYILSTDAATDDKTSGGGHIYGECAFSCSCL